MQADQPSAMLAFELLRMCKWARSMLSTRATPYPAARSLGEFAQLGRGDDLPCALDGRRGTLCVAARRLMETPCFRYRQ